MIRIWDPANAVCLLDLAIGSPIESIAVYSSPTTGFPVIVYTAAAGYASFDLNTDEL